LQVWSPRCGWLICFFIDFALREEALFEMQK